MFLCLLNKMVVGDENGDFVNEKDADNPGLGCALEMFTEHDEVLSILGKLKDIYEDEKAVELSTERFSYILDLYQEQPHLLDPYLDIMLNTILTPVRQKDIPQQLLFLYFQYLKQIMKVRGYKTVVRHMPHEVSDLKPVLEMLENQNKNDPRSRAACYVLLLWLSIIVKVPFHMSRFDDYTADIKPKSVAERILDVCKEYINDFGCFTVAVAFLSAHFITRSDIYEMYLDGFLKWIYEVIESPVRMLGKAEVNCVNVLATLSSILKHGKREDLLPYAPEILKKILSVNFESSKNTVHKKYATKIVQRVGLVFLKPKVAAWRYQRGNRSLMENLRITNANEDTQKPIQCGDMKGPDMHTVNEDEDCSVPDEIEEVIEYLLQGLRDSETVIRWSAAKGIGRVTGRLPKDLADEVVESVLELLNPNEEIGAWHGGCLTLAELGRRGLLLPQRLPVVVPLILKALVYEDSRGYYSKGDNVRDAACYVAWSFARAYDAQILKPYVNKLACGLLTVSLFDREVKCRRAASAAFQENVGRQGTFPHGIEIVTTADYFAVGMRQNSFLKISMFVGQFEEYTIPLIDHLVHKKIDHWDIVVRELTSNALFNMTRLKPDYMTDIVLKILVEKTKSKDLHCRHGAVIAVGEVIHSLKLLNVDIHLNVIEELKQLTYYYFEKNYFSGVGGEIMRQGFCKFIEKCSLAKLPLHSTQTVDDWQQLMSECLLSEATVMRDAAVSALNPFYEVYYQSDVPEIIEKRLVVINTYIGELLSLNKAARSGFSSAIGNFPRFMALDKLQDLVATLLECMKITEHTRTWAETRRDAMKALISIISTVGVEVLHDRCDTNLIRRELYLCEDAEPEPEENYFVHDGISRNSPVEEIFCALLNALRDYTTDTRGDIGAWVREAAISGLEKMVIMVAKWRKEMLSEALMTCVVGGVAKQALERIERTRYHAAKVFTSILYYDDPIIPNVPHRKELMEIFNEKCLTPEFARKSENENFSRYVKMLSFPIYTHYIIEGLIISVGGLTESLIRISSQALFSYLRSIDDLNELIRICMAIVDIFSRNSYKKKMIMPVFSFLDKLLCSGVISRVLDDPNNTFAENIFDLTKREALRTSDFDKFVGCMDVFCQLVQVKGKVSRRALSQMTVFLGYKLKSIRKEAARKLYECLLLYSDYTCIPEENLDEVMTLLSDTVWIEATSHIRPIRNKLCHLMTLPVPLMNVVKEEK